jgi:chorismate-pyruvate lyase
MLLSRTYRVISNELPVALITEKFPETHFRDA